MLIEDFTIETVEVNGIPVQTFKKRYRNLRQMFSESVAAHEKNLYLIEGDHRFTYGDTAELAAGMAELLRKEAGVGKGDHVGLLMENTVRFVIVFWAIQELGAVAVVFNTRLAPSELKRQLLFSDLKALLSTPTLSSRVQEAPSHGRPFRHIILREDWKSDLPQARRSAPAVEVDEDETALILFTSGTIGVPKGVMITHRNLITSAFKVGFVSSQVKDLHEIGPLTCLIAAPLFHVLAIQEQLIPAVFLGQACILMPVFEPKAFLELFRVNRVTNLVGTPTMYWLLLNKTPLREAKPDSVRSIGYGGAPMPPDLLMDIRRTFPGVLCMNGYGLTEASVISLLHDRYCESHPTSVGQPHLCSEVKIEDPLTGKELGPDAVGELAVRGALVSKGYYKSPEETTSFYRKGWFYTGDMAYRDADGFIYVVGRTREMINRGGENVYPVEVENVLHLHPKILDVSVFGLPDPVMGSIVACAIVSRPDTEQITAEEVQAFCRDQLASYKVPQRIFFVPDLPRNPGGKVIKGKLIEQFQTT
jgi:long-chain acyl-CoA synthetase